MTIWKFRLQKEAVRQTIAMPRGAQILCLQYQHNDPQIWALVDPTQPSQDRTFTQHGTGHDGVSGRYVGTYQVLDGRYVFHVFEDAA
jgi:hypothetical protein